MGPVVAALGALIAVFGVSVLRAAARERRALDVALASPRKAVVELKEGEPAHVAGVARPDGGPVLTPLGEEAVFFRLVVSAFERGLMTGQGDARGRWSTVFLYAQTAPKLVVEDDTGKVAVDAGAARWLVGAEHARTWSTAAGGTPPPDALIEFLEEKKAPIHSRRTGQIRTMKIVLERIRTGDVVDVFGSASPEGLIARGSELVVASSASIAKARGPLHAMAVRRFGALCVLAGAAAALVGLTVWLLL